MTARTPTWADVATAGFITALIWTPLGIAYFRTDYPLNMEAKQDMQKAICVGGPMDGQYAPNVDGEDIFLASAPPQLGVRYTRQKISVNEETVLYFYVAEGVQITAALHQVFARYTKKGK